MKKQFRLYDYSPTFSTRTRADEIASELDTFVKPLLDDELVIDFTGVEAISYSFLDQFLSRITESALLKEKTISITGWADNLLSVIDKSLQHRSCTYSQSNSGRTLVCRTN